MAVKSPRAEALTAWFRQNARDLPWRGTPDPYRVWVSEIMLQQTRVEAVRDKYRAFMAKFPTLRALADADEPAVLAAWSGLGYYRRARMLHAAARVVASRHDGVFPRDVAALEELPGIGRYTAGAIASIAFNQPAPIVDGNIERVFARWHGIDEDIRSPAARRRVWELARQWVEDGARDGLAPRDLNQSLMELGALVCTPRGPRCGECPVQTLCRAARDGRAEELPRRAPRAPRRDLRLWFVGLVDSNGKVLLVRRRLARSDSPLPCGLWELPHLPWPADQPPPLAAMRKLLGLRFDLHPDLFTTRHSIMDMDIALTLQTGTLVGSARFAPGWSRRCAARQALSVAQSSATTKLLRHVFASRHE